MKKVNKSAYQGNFGNYLAHLKDMFNKNEIFGTILSIFILAGFIYWPIAIVLFILVKEFNFLTLFELCIYFLILGLGILFLVYFLEFLQLTHRLLVKKLPSPPLTPEEAGKKLEKKLQDTKTLTIKVIQNPTNPVSIYSSKFGGLAYWPNNKEYPISDRGHKLRLLAQFNLSEVPITKYLPINGMLQFFIEDFDYTYGLFMNSKDVSNNTKCMRHRVVFHQKIEKDTSKLILINSDSNKNNLFPVKKEIAISFQQQEEYISISDYRFSQKKYLLDLYDNYSKSASENKLLFTSVYSKLFGYPSFFQTDPRNEYFKNKKEQFELLFQLASDGEVMWGDAGVGNFFIKLSKLKILDFSEVLFWWDCG